MVEWRMADPPNPPHLAQAIATMLTGRDEQTALLRRLVELGAGPRPEHHHQPPIPGYEQFLSTQPPLFHKMDEPLEADSWLRTIESKFTLHPYNDGDKAGFAAQGSRTHLVGQSRGHVPLGHSVHLGTVQGSFQGTSHFSRGDQKKTHGVLGPETGQ